MSEHSEHSPEESNEEMTLEKHLTISHAHKEACRECFIENTVRVEWKDKYLLHALEWKSHRECTALLYSGCDKWPHAFAGSASQPVMAAMWDTTCSPGPKLVAVWTLALGAGESDLHVLDGWDDDARELEEEEGMVEGVPEECSNSFCASSGDVVVEDLNCPALMGGSGPKKAEQVK